MSLVEEYWQTRGFESISRLRGAACCAMIADGLNQWEIVPSLGRLRQPAASLQLKTLRGIGAIDPELMVEAAAPMLTRVVDD